MTITVHVERLLLDGLPLTSRDGILVQAGIVSELERLLRDGDLLEAWNRGAAMPRLEAPGISVAAGDRAADIAASVANAVRGALAHPIRTRPHTIHPRRSHLKEGGR